jgi:hypothetical protein
MHFKWLVDAHYTGRSCSYTKCAGANFGDLNERERGVPGIECLIRGPDFQ